MTSKQISPPQSKVMSVFYQMAAREIDPNKNADQPLSSWGKLPLHDDLSITSPGSLTKQEAFKVVPHVL